MDWLDDLEAKTRIQGLPSRSRHQHRRVGWHLTQALNQQRPSQTLALRLWTNDPLANRRQFRSVLVERRTGLNLLRDAMPENDSSGQRRLPILQ